jgi:Tfp pilus assembly protein PilO
MPINPIPEVQLGAARRRTLYERRRLVQGALLMLLIVNVVLGFFAFRPNPIERGELERLRIERRGRQETVDRLRQIQASLVESARRGDQFYDVQFLPASTGYATLMEEVERIANATGVKKGSESYSSQPVKDRPGIEAVDIDTSVDGDYSKMVRFINQLEQSKLFFIVDSLGVGSNQTKGVRLSVKLVTYFKVPKGAGE